MTRMKTMLGYAGAKRLARGLGWFSIALGALELLAPRRVGDALGMQHESGAIQAYGAREIASGIGILAARDPTPWIWARVIGDALDLATLAPNADPRNPQRPYVLMAIGAVAGVALLDYLCADGLARKEDDHRSRRDYADRSGFPQSPNAMRGAAREPEMVSTARH
ncbi:cyclase dehydrase [Chthonobacter albigriseus]|uniref:cyclase dehydrase n=1 Tax=Chthonobacter albigriseus TaxID=1683161 RepID=UPI0015EE78F3|nr:cyclase dehydrase [Chthonobacter albigriseus]